METAVPVRVAANRPEEMMPRTSRRDVLGRIGAAALATLGTGAVEGQAPAAPGDFTPTLHPLDAWMSEASARHRVVIDVPSATGVPDALRFAGNLLSGHQTGYGLQERDVSVLVCFRHGATGYGYANDLWARFGRIITPSASPAPTAHPYNSGERRQIDDLAARGVRFMVCALASRGLAGRFAGPDGDADAMLKEIGEHLVTNARLVPAGVIGVTHAQERGYALLFVG